MFTTNSSYKPVCEQSFSQQVTLKKHINDVHNKYKPNTCPVCQHSFSEKYNLKNHNKLKPHTYLICQQSFLKRKYVNCHMNLVQKKILQLPAWCVCHKLFSAKRYVGAVENSLKKSIVVLILLSNLKCNHYMLYILCTRNLSS